MEKVKMNIRKLTPERKYFNEVYLPKFISSFVKQGDLVVDVGKPLDIFGYRQAYEATGAVYKTLDKKKDYFPDIWDNMEDTKLQEGSVDCIGGYGIWEGCGNPFKLIAGIRKVLKSGGYGVFGIMSIGFPMLSAIEVDKWRFTPNGATKLLCGFNILDLSERDRGGAPSYVFVVVQKR